MSEQTTYQVKLFAKSDGSANLVCPACGFARNMDFSKYHGQNSFSVKARCKCRALLDITVEFRSTQRKTVELDGTFKSLDPDIKMQGSMTVYDLSWSGLAFVVSGSAQPMVGMRLDLSFTLDNTRRDTIHTEAVVKSIRDDLIGCEFDFKGQEHGALGFYLRG